jgi:hypothetical protein
MNADMIVGQRYRIRYRPSGVRLDREIVADLLEPPGTYVRVSGRPVFGTSSIPSRSVVSVTPAPGVPCHAPKIVR